MSTFSWTSSVLWWDHHYLELHHRKRQRRSSKITIYFLNHCFDAEVKSKSCSVLALRPSSLSSVVQSEVRGKTHCVPFCQSHLSLLFFSLSSNFSLPMSVYYCMCGKKISVTKKLQIFLHRFSQDNIVANGFCSVKMISVFFFFPVWKYTWSPFSHSPAHLNKVRGKKVIPVSSTHVEPSH